MFFNTHFPRISAVQLQQPRLHWVVGALFPTKFAAAGDGTRGPPIQCKNIHSKQHHYKHDLENEP